MTKRLLLFGMNRLTEAVAKGNLSYLRHYERYFDEVCVVYLHGYCEKPVSMGKTTCISTVIGFTTCPQSMAQTKRCTFSAPSAPTCI